MNTTLDQNAIVSNSLCEICHSASWRYKCSVCCLRHCSLTCYKLHKDKPECQPPDHNFTIEDEPVPLVPLDLGDDCSDYVPTRLLNQLGESDRLKELFRNPHLRNYLIQLDSSNHPAKAIEHAMKEPLFIEFADECMRILHPDEYKTKTAPFFA